VYGAALVTHALGYFRNQRDPGQVEKSFAPELVWLSRLLSFDCSFVFMEDPGHRYSNTNMRVDPFMCPAIATQLNGG
jgi:hypothetical protein